MQLKRKARFTISINIAYYMYLIEFKYYIRQVIYKQFIEALLK